MWNNVSRIFEKKIKHGLKLWICLWVLTAFCALLLGGCAVSSGGESGEEVTGAGREVPASSLESSAEASEKLGQGSFGEGYSEMVSIEASADGQPISASLRRSEDETSELREVDVDPAELPFAVHVRYFLEEEEVQAEDLLGQTGHIRIRFEYENLSKKSVTVDGKRYESMVPFVFISLVSLPEDRFSDVASEEGEILQMGDARLFYAYCVPGLQEALASDKLMDALDETRSAMDEDFVPEEREETKDYVEVSAYAVNFKLDFTATLVSNGLLSELKEDKLDSLSEMIDSLAEMKDTSADLDEGKEALSDGLEEFGDGLSAYTGGAYQLSVGAASLAEGAKGLADGVAALSAQSGALTQGAADLAAGLAALEQSMGSMTLSEEDLAALTAVNPELAAKLSAQLGAQMAVLSESISALSSGAGSLSEGVAAYTAGVDALSEGASQLSSGADALSTGAGNLSYAGVQLKDGYSELSDGVLELLDGLDELRDKLLDPMGDLAEGALPDSLGRLKALRQIDAEYLSFVGDEASEGVSFILETEAIR